MPRVFITANDTGVGKTWVTAAVASLLMQQGAAVHVVKPVETGVSDGGRGDAEWIEDALQEKATLSGKVSCQTLRRYSQPLAPLEAAVRDGKALDYDEIVHEINQLPADDWCLVEGAGGLAVPLSEGAEPQDWADFAHAIEADYVVLVVEDRLGAINQARLLSAYAQQKALNAGWWLNQSNADAPSDVREVNYRTLSALSCPLWGVQDFGAPLPRKLDAPWLKL